MVAKCPDVLLVFEALRIIMGNISGPRSHPSEYPTLLLSSPVNLNSPTYLKTQSMFITWRMWALWLLAGSEWCAWDYIRRNPGLWLEGSSVRIGRMLNPSCKDWEQRVQAVAVSWGDNQQTILGGCLHCASCSPCPLEAVSLEHVCFFFPSQTVLIFCCSAHPSLFLLHLLTLPIKLYLTFEYLFRKYCLRLWRSISKAHMHIHTHTWTCTYTQTHMCGKFCSMKVSF